MISGVPLVICRENLDVPVVERFFRAIGVDLVTICVLIAAMLMMYGLFGQTSVTNVLKDGSDDKIKSTWLLGSARVDLPTPYAVLFLLVLSLLFKWILHVLLRLFERPRSFTEGENGNAL